MANTADCSGCQATVRWVTPKEAAAVCDVGPEQVREWCRSRKVVARRLPGARGRLRVAVDAHGFPVAA